jgi:large subunit ribosomal protein L44
MFFSDSNKVHRWVAPTLSEIRSRRKKVGPEPDVPRSTFIDWNYDAEIYAFGIRLNEKFDVKILQNAFVDRSYIVQEEMKQRAVGIENPILHITDNRKLIEKGEKILKDFINAFLTNSLPKYPSEGIQGIYKYLISDSVLSEVSSKIGTKDLILSSDYPFPTNEVLASTFKAVVGALVESSGEKRAAEFIRDILLTQLNQKDINEYWNIKNPMQLLKEICKGKKLGEPEPRLIGDTGKNTILACYHVGMYCNKRQVGSGFGEDITIATDQAALDTLRNFFGTNLNMKPIDFTLPIDVVYGESKQTAEKI